jgi:translation initiation factor 1
MAKKTNDLSSLGGLVFSTNRNVSLDSNEFGEMQTLQPGEQKLKVWLEKNHRGGKVACVIKDFVGSSDDLHELATKLKQKCGTGGSAKDGEIVIQGDHRDKIISFLTQWGYQAKKAGG